MQAPRERCLPHHKIAMRGWLVWVAVLASWLVSPLAWAHPVTIYVAADTEYRAPETATRLRGELLTLGFAVTLQSGGSPPNPQPAPPTTVSPAVTGATDAVMQVTATPTDLTVEIRISSEVEPYLQALTLTEPQRFDKAPERLAIRAAEALRSRLLERDLAKAKSSQGQSPEPHQPHPPQAPPLTSVTRESAPIHDARKPTDSTHVSPLGVAVGGCLLSSTRGLGVAVLPLLQLDWSATKWLGVHATLSGLGSRSSAASTNGAVWVSQHFGLLGASYRPPKLGLAAPFVGASVGAMLYSVDARAEAPLQAHDSSRAVWLGQLSAGTEIELSRRFYLNLAAHAQLTQPKLVLHIVEDVAAVSGRPNLLASLALGVYL